MKKRRKLKIFLIIIITFVIVCIGLFVRFIYPMLTEAQDTMYEVLSTNDDSAFVRSGNTTIYSSDGTTLASLGNEKYEYVEITDISTYITDGYIAYEDRKFTTHSGIDLKAIARAAGAYIKNRGNVTQGGSTITQQLVKNCLLSNEQTIQRKITEALLAIQIERVYSKAQIMEYYCNYNYYGNGCYGVEGASQYYFGKSAADVDLAEAAILVGTSNAPSVCNPVTDYDGAMEKKDVVLGTMYECGYITEEEYAAASEEEPEIVKKTEDIINEPYLASYALHCATLKLMQNDGFVFQYTFDNEQSENDYEEAYGQAYNDAQQTISSGGYVINTTLNIDIENQLQSSVDNNLAGFQDKTEDGIYTLQAGAVCIDNGNGMVVAIVGGREGSGDYNRGYQAKRQPGSSIKPIVDYGPALDNGTLFIGSTFTDRETTVNGYTPKNSSGSYSGDMTARDALIRSINTIALQVYELSGPSTVMSYLDKLRFSSISYADMNSAAVSLGGLTEGASVEDMARAYSALAMGGKISKNDCILSITDYLGEEVYTASDAMEEVYTDDTAFILTDVLHGSFAESYGLASSAETNGQFYAGKTGTTNSNYDAWFCGYSAYYTTAVWVGYDYPADLEFHGSDYPLNIWIGFMNSLHENLEPKEFDIPQTVMLMSYDEIMTIPVDYTSDFYNSRPSGYDYCSTTGSEKVRAANSAAQEEAREQAAEEAVNTFEAFVITSTSDDTVFQELYSQAYDAVSAVTDDELRSSLLKRLEVKEEELVQEFNEKWLPIKEAEQEEAALQESLDNASASQEAYENRERQIKNNRISLVYEYIDAINSCMVKTNELGTLIENAKEALANCSGYSEYNELASALSSAIDRANSLPTPSESVTAPTVEVPQESTEAAEQQTETQAQSGTVPEENTEYTTGNNG